MGGGDPPRGPTPFQGAGGHAGVLRRHPDAGCKAHGNKGRVCVPARPTGAPLPHGSSPRPHQHTSCFNPPRSRYADKQVPNGVRGTMEDPETTSQCELVHVKMAAAFRVKPARNGNATWRLPRPAVAPREPDGTYGPSEGKLSGLKKGRRRVPPHRVRPLTPPDRRSFTASNVPPPSLGAAAEGTSRTLCVCLCIHAGVRE